MTRTLDVRSANKGEGLKRQYYYEAKRIRIEFYHFSPLRLAAFTRLTDSDLSLCNDAMVCLIKSAQK